MGKMKKEDILANCIDEILAGKSTVEDCLARYPHLSDELRPLLEIALGIQTEEVTPSPEFRQRARKRLLEAMQPAVAPTERRGVDIFGWLKPLARRTAVAIVVAALLVGGGATAYAAQDSMPDEVLYPVKMATEKARLAVIPSEAGKAGLHIAFAEHRVQEMVEMCRRGRVEEMPGLATAVDYHLEQAQGLMGIASAEGIDIYELGVRLEQSAFQQLGVLESTLDEVPEETKPAIVQALETSGEEYATAIEAVASIGPVVSAAPRATEEPMMMVTEEEAILMADMGTIQIRATDPPPPEADSVLVEVGEIEIHRVAGPETAWLTIVGEPVTFDLLVIGEVQKFLGSQEVPDGTYTQLRFAINEATVTVGGEEHDVVVPSGKLKLVRPFQVEKGEITLVLLDFDGVESLHVTGGGQFILRPKVNLLVPPTVEVDEDEGEEEEEEVEEIKETKVEIEGTIASFSETELLLVVAGEEVVITLDALTEIEGDLEEGAWAEVKAVAEDGVFLAMEVEVEVGEQERGREREKGWEKERERVEAEGED